ncbi:MAG: ATP-binding protein, partial [Anaerolineae bacterium]|nr:ATP-binding protein [Anaerolineae bacterium]
EDGHVRLSGEAEGKLLHIRVEDNGIGMSPEELGQLGTPYFRADNDLVLSYKGSGLGIPIAFGLIRLLGGSIGAASQPGQGTTFTLTLTGMG